MSCVWPCRNFTEKTRTKIREKFMAEVFTRNYSFLFIFELKLLQKMPDEVWHCWRDKQQQQLARKYPFTHNFNLHACWFSSHTTAPVVQSTDASAVEMSPV